MRTQNTLLGISLPLLVALTSCNSTPAKPLGDEGAACYADDRCNAQLTCVGKVCIKPGPGSTDGAAGTDGGAGADGGAADGAAGTDGAAGADSPGADTGGDVPAADASDATPPQDGADGPNETGAGPDGGDGSVDVDVTDGDGG